MLPERPDAVLFDAGGVFVIPDPAVLGPLLVTYGADPSWASLHRAHYAGMRAIDTEGERHDDWRAYDRAYVRAAGVGREHEDEAVAVLSQTRNPWIWRAVIPEAVIALRVLHERGVPVGIVSNASGQIEGVLRRGGVAQVGSGRGAPVLCVVDSHVVGVAKPNPAIFRPALDILGLEPSRVAYVGDSFINDVAGARAAGLIPVQVDPYDDQPGRDHLRIRSLLELLPVFS